MFRRDRVWLVFLLCMAPGLAFAAATASLPYRGFDRTVMGDAAQVLVVRVCNTGGNPVDQVEFRFGGGNNQYDFAEIHDQLTVPGWTSDWLDDDRVRFSPSSAADRLPVGGCLDFDLHLEGNGDSPFQSQSGDRTDRFDRIDVRHTGGATDNVAGQATWTRHALALTLVATPSSVLSGGPVRLSYLVENRSTSNQVGIVSLPSAPATAPAGQVSGPTAPTPASLSLNADVKGEMTWDGTATGTGPTFRFDAAVGNAGATSPPTYSNEVTIGAFTSQITVVPDTSVSGQTFDVVLRVRNLGPYALGNVRPSADPASRSAVTDLVSVGTAATTKVSGPVPAEIPSLAPGGAMDFRWTYSVTGSVGQTYRFQGGAIANGSGNNTNLATSNTGTLAAVTLRVDPPSIARGDTGPLTFYLANGTAFSSARHVRITFPNGFTLAGASLPGWTCALQGGNRTAECNPIGSETWSPGEVLPIQVTFTPTGVPLPTGDADDPYPVQAHYHLPEGATNSESQINVLVQAYRLQLSATPAGALAADGESTRTITATATRVSTGLPVPGAAVQLLASVGTLSANDCVTSAAGTCSVSLVAPVSCAPVSGTVEGRWYSRVEQVTVDYSALGGASLLYVGGSLYPRQVAPGTGAAFEVTVQNAGCADTAILSAATTSFQWSDPSLPGCSYQTFLAADVPPVAPGALATLSFASGTVPVACVVPPDTSVTPTFTYNPTRTVGDALRISASPTFASVLGFGVEPYADGARLLWSTDLEILNTGFRVLRATDGGEPELLDAWIPSSGESFSDYEWIDAPLGPGVHEWWLEDVAEDGVTTRHGPVALAIGGAAGSGAPDDIALLEAPGGRPAGAEVWNDPDDLGDVRILELDPNGITYEITPAPFEALAAAGGQARLRIPGWSTLDEPGRPELPVRFLLVPIPPHLTGRLTLRTVEDEAVHAVAPTMVAGGAPGPDPYPAADLEVEAAAEAAVGAAWPESPAVLLDRGRMRDRRIVSLVLTPIRLEPGGALRNARRIVARVDFVPAAAPVSAERTEAERVQARIVASSSLRVDVSRPGLVRVPLAEISAAGVAVGDVAVGDVAVFRRGVPVPSRIEAGEVVFYATDGANHLAATSAYFIAARGTEVARILPAVGTAPSAQDSPSAVSRDEVFEQNRIFGQMAAQGYGLDRWYWTQAMTSGPVRAGVTLDVAGPAPSGPSRLAVALQGMFDDERFEDEHRVRVYLNGLELGQVVFGDFRRVVAELDVPDGGLVSGANLLEIEVGSPGLSRVALDTVRATWTTAADAAGAGELSAVSRSAGPLTAVGLAAPVAYVVDETEPGGPALLAFSSAAPGSATIDVPTGHRVRFVTSGAPAAFSARAPGGSPFEAGAADWIAVSAPSLLSQAEAFAAWRRARDGFRTAVVSTDAIRDTLGFGDPDPGAIRRFLELTAAGWTPPAPRYVLLLGDSTLDPRGYTSSPPAALVLSGRLATRVLDAPTDTILAALGDEDYLPDIAIGRIPAATPEGAEAALANTIAHETAPRDGWDRRQLVLADDDLPLFSETAGLVEAYLPLGMQAENIAASEEGATGAKTRLLEALSNGVALATYVGHGSVQTWGAEPFLRTADVPGLGQSRAPVMIAVDCLNAYFDHPLGESLGEALVETPGSGAAAVWTSSAITRDGGHQALARAFHRAFWREAGHRIGDVAAAAYASIAARGDAEELIGTFVLFGDPALAPNVNQPPVAVADLEAIEAAGAARLSGLRSYDADGDALAFRWQILAGPPGASLDDPYDPEPLLRGAPGTYRLRLQVADRHVPSAPDDVVIELRASEPAGGSPRGCAVAPGARALPSLLLLALALAARHRRRR